MLRSDAVEKWRRRFGTLASGIALLCLCPLACSSTSNQPSSVDGSGMVDRPVATDVAFRSDVALDARGSRCKLPAKVANGAVGTCVATPATSLAPLKAARLPIRRTTRWVASTVRGPVKTPVLPPSTRCRALFVSPPRGPHRQMDAASHRRSRRGLSSIASLASSHGRLRATRARPGRSLSLNRLPQPGQARDGFAIAGAALHRLVDRGDALRRHRCRGWRGRRRGRRPDARRP